MTPSFVRTAIAGFMAALMLGASCCGNPCSSTLVFSAPVPAMELKPGETATFELFENVWAVSSYCSGGPADGDLRFLDIAAASENNGVASVALLTSSKSSKQSLLQVTAHAPGETLVVLRASGEIDCEDVRDATHFRVTVTG